MTAEIGHGASVAALTRSIQELADMLKSANDQTMNLAQKLLKTQVQEKLADSSLGSKIDTQA